MLFISYLYKLLQAQRLLVDGVNPRLIDVPEGFGCQIAFLRKPRIVVKQLVSTHFSMSLLS